MAAVEKELEALSGVEIHGGKEEGKLIITVEDTESASAADTMMGFSAIKCVISATLIYHYGGNDLDEEVSHDIN